MRNAVWAPLTVADVARLLAGCGARWWLSGGWAIDHWLGNPTREHGDIDVSTLQPDLGRVLEALPSGLRPFAAARGQVAPLAGQVVHNIWVRDVARERWVLQVNVEDGDADGWRYRRAPSIALPWADAVAVRHQVPTATPMTQLLWKSRGPRPCDEHDLDAVLPVLGGAERRWLREAIRAAHPDSPWASDARLGPRVPGGMPLGGAGLDEG